MYKKIEPGYAGEDRRTSKDSTDWKKVENGWDIVIRYKGKLYRLDVHSVGGVHWTTRFINWVKRWIKGE